MACLFFRRSTALRRFVAALGLTAVVVLGCKSPPRATVPTRPPVAREAVPATAQHETAQQEAAQQTAAIVPLPPTSAPTEADEVVPAVVLLTIDEAVTTS